MIPITFQARVVAETNKQRAQQLHGSGLRRHSAEGRHCETLAEQGEVRQRSVWRGVVWQGEARKVV